jgi:RNA polymerase II-associated factor 1
MSGAARRLELGDFVCPYHFGAGLPPLPADPKLLEIDFERASFVRFRAKYELLPEPDLGITIDLVDPEAFAAAAPGTELDAADEELLSASAFAQALGDRKGIAAVAKEMRENVTFLRKTPIMSNNL